MNLRKIALSDKEKYLDMVSHFYHSDAVDHTVNKSNFEAAFSEFMRSNDYTECYFIEENSQIAGYIITLKSYSQEAGGICVWIDEVWLEPEFRGLGIGSKALKQVMALYEGAARFRLEYSPANSSVANFYAKLGFEELNYRQMCLDKNK